MPFFAGKTVQDAAFVESYHIETSGGERNNRNTSGQRINKFSTSFRDILVIVAENNSVVKPKC